MLLLTILTVEPLLLLFLQPALKGAYYVDLNNILDQKVGRCYPINGD